MAYRTFKRVLSETSLERKCRWWFGISLGILLLLSFSWYLQQTDELVENSTRQLGRELVRAGLLEVHLLNLSKYYEQPQAHDVVAKNDPNFFRDFYESSRQLKLGRDFQWDALLNKYGQDGDMGSDAMGADLLEVWKKNTWSDLVAKNKDDPLADFQSDNVVNVEGKRTYLYYLPIYAENYCIDCHKQVLKQDFQEGELMAVARVAIDQKRIADAQAQNWALAWTQALVVGFLSMFSLWAIIRYVVVKPVTHLRDVSNAIRQGDTSQRAEIRTGDEFEELAAAFNRMLRQLLSQQDELRQVNEELDTRLDELAQANMRLFEMNRLKGDFLATVSHELRTPLNSIIGFSDVLLTIDTLDDKQKRYAANIQRSGRILLDMIDDILDLAKMESGKMDLKPSRFQIAAVVSAQCEMARPLTEKKNIDLEYLVSADLPPLYQDQAKVQQILNNLLSNAIKFTPEGGRISVTAERDGAGDLRLTVTDTGVGISEEDQLHVFEKFRQGSSAAPGGDTMTREHSGTGLGLSIVRELCRLLGGDVTLQSALGKGSTFAVHIPWQLQQTPRLDAHLRDDLNALRKPEIQKRTLDFRKRKSDENSQHSEVAPEPLATKR